MTRSNAKRTGQPFIVAGVLAFGAIVGLPRAAHAQSWATAKPQFVWNQQEREAVEVVKVWADAWATKDPQKVAKYMAENCMFRGDPSQPLQSGRAAFVTLISRFIRGFDSMKIDEIFVMGTEWDTAVLIKRTHNISPNSGDALAGRAVPIASFFRVKNRQITEWLDVPITSISPLAQGSQRTSDAAPSRGN